MNPQKGRPNSTDDPSNPTYPESPAGGARISHPSPDDPEGYVALLDLFTALDRMLVHSSRQALDPLHLHYNDFVALRSISLGRADTPSVLARVVGITLPATSELIDRLVAQGWVIRAPSPTDRRSYRLELTENGLSTYRAASEALHQSMARICEKLPMQSRQGLETGLHELWQSVQSAIVGLG